jgi:hypothetical protein
LREIIEEPKEGGLLLFFARADGRGQEEQQNKSNTK